MSNPSKNKGSAAEREVATLLSEALGTEIKRNIAASRGDETEDIRFQHNGKTYLVEVKRRENLSKGAWLKQAEKHAKRNGTGIPVVVYRKNREPWHVHWRIKNGSAMTLPFDLWVKHVLHVKKPKENKSLRLIGGVLHHGDCLDVMRKMDAESIGAVVTSPPYNLMNTVGRGFKSQNIGIWKNARLGLEGGYSAHDDDMPHDEYVAWQRKCLTEMMRLLKPNGVVFYNHKWRQQNCLLQRLGDEITADFPVRQIIIWNRKSGFLFNKRFLVPAYEVVYMIAKPDFLLADEAFNMLDVWDFTFARGNKHPAPFPVKLASNCLQTVTEGPVLDPFMGSGTTAVAAIRKNMEWIGIEKSKEYVDMTANRLRGLWEST